MVTRMRLNIRYMFITCPVIIQIYCKDNHLKENWFKKYVVFDNFFFMFGRKVTV